MTSTSASLDSEVRNRLAIALDVDDLERAVGLAKDLAPWFGVAKVGLELYSTAGPEAVVRLREAGLSVFADLKLHDIPNTVERSARVLGRLGVRYLNFHAAGGVDMLRAGLTGLSEGAAERGYPEPVGLGVTVLTSDTDTRAFPERLDAAIDAGCGGVVCSVQEVETVKRVQRTLVTVVPGVRLADDDRNDQRRTGTPEAVVAAGADVLVIGRSVTNASEPTRVARAIADAVQTTTSRVRGG
jgi:orotidine-5'-phosphate decarboxylase